MSVKASAQVGGGEWQEQKDSLKEKARPAPLAGNKLLCLLCCQGSHSLGECMLCHTVTPLKDGESKLVCKLNSTPPTFQGLQLHRANQAFTQGNMLINLLRVWWGTVYKKESIYCSSLTQISKGTFVIMMMFSAKLPELGFNNLSWSSKFPV